MKGECVLRAPLTYGKTVEGVPNGTLLSSVSGGVDNKGILQAPFGEVIYISNTFSLRGNPRSTGSGPRRPSRTDCRLIRTIAGLWSLLNDARRSGRS